ncbi:hypothetical protein NP493_5024g00001, partial [Ridgeia piscesae]
RHDTILTTTTPSPYCFYCSVHDTGPTRCLSRHYVCDGVNDCWDKSDERNCTMSPDRVHVAMNGVVLGLVVLAAIVIIGGILLAVVKALFCSNRRRTERSRVADTVAADIGHQTTPLVEQTVPLNPPPSYTEVCESMAWASYKNG